MQRHQQILFAAVALAVWASAANAAPPDPDGDIAEAPAPVRWQLVEARNHASGANGIAAVLFGIAQERARSHQASLRVDCVDGRTIVRVDAVGISPGPFAVAVKYSLDGGRFVSGSWNVQANGDVIELSGEPAIAFVNELYGKAELRLAVVRPLSVPFLFAFVVDGAERALRPMAERCQWSAGPSLSKAGR